MARVKVNASWVRERAYVSLLKRVPLFFEGRLILFPQFWLSGGFGIWVQ